MAVSPIRAGCFIRIPLFSLALRPRGTHALTVTLLNVLVCFACVPLLLALLHILRFGVRPRIAELFLLVSVLLKKRILKRERERSLFLSLCLYNNLFFFFLSVGLAGAPGAELRTLGGASFVLKGCKFCLKGCKFYPPWGASFVPPLPYWRGANFAPVEAGWW